MAEKSDLGHFDFETWAALAKRDPARFEEARGAILEAALGAVRDGSRLRALQSRIDLERRRARTPLKSCLRLSSMMWDSLMNLQGSLIEKGFGRPSELPKAIADPSPAAKVIPFPYSRGIDIGRRS